MSGVIKKRMEEENISEGTEQSDCPGLRDCCKNVAF